MHVCRIDVLPLNLYTGPVWDPYWVVTALSPILLIMLFVKTILMIVSDGLFRKYCAIQVLAVIVSCDHACMNRLIVCMRHHVYIQNSDIIIQT